MSHQPPSPYQKPWLSYADQVVKLQNHGLNITDSAAAQQFLSHVNYYRFSGYCLAFERNRHRFCAGTTFEDIVAAYDFDRILRDLMTESLEIVEIDLRTSSAHHFAAAYGCFGHTEASNFFGRFAHADWLARIHDETQRSNEQFVRHFRRRYSEYPDLPVWIAMEVMSFGSLSKMYQGMCRPDQKEISRRYGLQPIDFIGIVHHLVYVRNLCAHHSRLWDRIWSIKPTLPRGHLWQPPSLPSNDRMYSTLLIQYDLLTRCPSTGSFAKDWRNRLHSLLAHPPKTPDALARMGMPANWKSNALWR